MMRKMKEQSRLTLPGDTCQLLTMTDQVLSCRSSGNDRNWNKEKLKRSDQKHDLVLVVDEGREKRKTFEEVG